MASFDMLTPAKEAELKENLWQIAKLEKAVRQEEAKLVSDGKQMAQKTDDILAEMDQGLSQFRAKMKAKKAESEAALREQDREFECLCVSPLAAGSPAADAAGAGATASDSAQPSPVDATNGTGAESEPSAAAGSRFKMSLYSRVRPKKEQLNEIKG